MHTASRRGRVVLFWSTSTVKQNKLPKLYTQQGLAELLDVPAYSIRYVVKTRNVTAALTVGGRKLFDDAALREIRQFLLELSWRNRRSNRSVADAV